MSNNDGPLNYTLGYTYLSGDSPYVYRDMYNGPNTGSARNNNDTFYQDTTAICLAEKTGDDGLTGMARGIANGTGVAGYNTGGCYGTPTTAYHSDVTNAVSYTHLRAHEP